MLCHPNAAASPPGALLWPGRRRVGSTHNTAGRPRRLTAAARPKVLEGMLVLELANVLAGPSVCQFLAELGADVLKV